MDGRRADGVGGRRHPATASRGSSPPPHRPNCSSVKQSDDSSAGKPTTHARRPTSTFPTTLSSGGTHSQSPRPAATFCSLPTHATATSSSQITNSTTSALPKRPNSSPCSQSSPSFGHTPPKSPIHTVGADGDVIAGGQESMTEVRFEPTYDVGRVAAFDDEPDPRPHFSHPIRRSPLSSQTSRPSPGSWRRVPSAWPR